MAEAIAPGLEADREKPVGHVYTSRLLIYKLDRKLRNWFKRGGQVLIVSPFFQMDQGPYYNKYNALYLKKLLGDLNPKEREAVKLKIITRKNPVDGLNELKDFKVNFRHSKTGSNNYFHVKLLAFLPNNDDIAEIVYTSANFTEHHYSLAKFLNEEYGTKLHIDDELYCNRDSWIKETITKEKYKELEDLFTEITMISKIH